MMTNAMTITDLQILQLRDEAAAAGDTEMVQDCEEAVYGKNPDARERCESAIVAAQAMAGDDGDPLPTTAYPDGRVRLWDVFRQQWTIVWAASVPASILATLPQKDRDLIAATAARAMDDDSDAWEGN